MRCRSQLNIGGDQKAKLDGGTDILLYRPGWGLIMPLEQVRDLRGGFTSGRQSFDSISKEASTGAFHHAGQARIRLSPAACTGEKNFTL